MSKKCAKCDKTVYPLEEIKCLEKIWHKSCFKCEECGMTLNMRNYKGFNRLPYCTAHCPQAKHTTVADTPEIRRIQENTKIQSSVKYHEEFEKQKGKVTQIADDPETLRIRQNTRIISNVAYHGDLERKAAMEQKRPAVDGTEDGTGDALSNDDDLRSVSPINSVSNRQSDMIANQGSVSYKQESQPMVHGGSVPGMSHNVPQQQQQQHQQPPLPQQPQQQQQQYQPSAVQHAALAAAEHETLHANKDSPYSSRQASTVIYTSELGPVSSPPQRRIGSIANYDPINDNYGSVATAQQQQHHQVHHHQQQPNQYRGGDQGVQQQQHIQQHQQQQQQHAPKSTGLTYRAMYDYKAMDSDEVSFMDGDIIVNCTAVDEGWMTGIVQRTNHRGLLPANYVEPYN